MVKGIKIDSIATLNNAFRYLKSFNYPERYINNITLEFRKNSLLINGVEDFCNKNSKESDSRIVFTFTRFEELLKPANNSFLLEYFKNKNYLYIDFKYNKYPIGIYLSVRSEIFYGINKENIITILDPIYNRKKKLITI